MSNTLFADNTQSILDDGVECHNDFVSLAISGENLRGYAAAKELNPPELASYDEFLRSYKGEAPDSLESTMADTMADLFTYARESRITRDWEVGTGLLDDINDGLALAAAMTRAGRWEVSRLKEFAIRARQVIDCLVPKLLDLCQYAEDHQLIYMSDGEWFEQGLFDVYSFWEPMAYFSLSRMEMQATVASWARRTRIIDNAVRAFAAKHP